MRPALTSRHIQTRPPHLDANGNPLVDYKQTPDDYANDQRIWRIPGQGQNRQNPWYPNLDNTLFYL
jgi:hypothetical protein